MRISEYVRADLLSSFGTFRLASASITETVNAGCNWSANLVDFIDLNPLDVPETMIFTLRFQTLSDIYISPPLVVESPGIEASLSGRFGSLSGIDEKTWLLSKDDLSLDTFVNSNSQSIITRCCQTETGVIINGLENFPMAEDDVKNSKILDVLTRYLAITGQNYKINSNGTISCFPASYIGPVNEALRYTKIASTKNYSARVDSMKIEKTSRVSTAEEVCFLFDSVGYKTVQLPQPLWRAFPIDRSTYGYINLVTTFNGSLGGPVTGIFKFITNGDDIVVTPGSIDTSLPTTHASLVMNQPHTLIGQTPIAGKLCFAGSPANPTPPNQPIEVSAAFRRQIGSTAGSLRPDKSIWTDTLVPSPAWVESHKLDWMTEKNKGYWPMNGDCPLNLTVSLTQGFTSPGFPIGKIESFTHSIDVRSNKATTTISGYVPWTPDDLTVTSF